MKYKPIPINFSKLNPEDKIRVVEKIVSPRIKCPYCKEEIPDYSNFCCYCAKKLAKAEAETK